jgi:hypothetical protein
MDVFTACLAKLYRAAEMIGICKQLLGYKNIYVYSPVPGLYSELFGKYLLFPVESSDFFIMLSLLSIHLTCYERDSHDHET